MRAMLADMSSRVGDYVRIFRARRQPVRNAADLSTVLAGEAAHVAQSAIYAYLRARAGFMAPRLFTEKLFLETLEVTRWEAFGSVLADMFIIAEGLLRPHAGADASGLGGALADRYRATLAAHPAPAHRPGGWQPFVDDFAARMADVQSRAPESCDAVAARSGRRVFDALPIHDAMRRPDEEIVINSVRFRVLSTWENLAPRIDRAAVAADLVAPVAAAARS